MSLLKNATRALAYERSFGEDASSSTEDSVEKFARPSMLMANNNANAIRENPLSGGKVLTANLGTVGNTGKDIEITHNLGRQPVGCMVININGSSSPTSTGQPVAVQLHKRGAVKTNILFSGTLFSYGSNVKVTFIIF
jgi:hypothetical protein